MDKKYKLILLSMFALSSFSITQARTVDCYFDEKTGSNKCAYQFQRHGSYGSQDLNVENDNLTVQGVFNADIYASQYYQNRPEKKGIRSEPLNYNYGGKDYYEILLHLLEHKEYTITGVYNDTKAEAEVYKYKINENINYIDRISKSSLINHIKSNKKFGNYPIYYETDYINVNTKSNWILIEGEAHNNDPDHVKFRQIIAGIDREHFNFKAESKSKYYLKDYSGYYPSDIYLSEYPCTINGECASKFNANLRYCMQHKFIKSCNLSGPDYKDLFIVYDLGDYYIERYLKNTRKGTIVEFKTYRTHDNYSILDKNIEIKSGE